MAELTREKRACIAEHLKAEPDNRYLVGGSVAVIVGEIRALLDAADERDRLRLMIVQAVNCLQFAYDKAGNNASADPVNDYEDAIVAVLAHLKDPADAPL